ESDGCFTPVYEEQYLSGAKVGIYAGEDIYTADGTRRYEKDELIETLETLSSGPVLTSELFEGVYYAKELSAPAGYVLGDAEPVEVCLFSDDLSVGFSNQRQKCELKFVKCFDDGSTDFSAVTFGVFTASPILDLPADSLLEVMQVDSSGKCTMTCDLPCGYDYYVRELTTASGFAMSTADLSFTFSPMSDDEEVFSVTFDPVVNYKMIVGGAASVASPDTGDDNGDAIRFYIITAVEALALLVVVVVRKNKLTLYY
ncbi:MAG: prealbumin-like fold domain-containing protein, partial [Clostridia bacterium]|nr:prealbumin-like fold domain-containing protein [Clostridia bacterium]